jgi:hypothetical protein
MCGEDALDYMLENDAVIRLPASLIFRDCKGVECTVPCGALVGVEVISDTDMRFYIQGDTHTRLESTIYHYASREGLGKKLIPYLHEFWPYEITITGVIDAKDAAIGETHMFTNEMGKAWCLYEARVCVERYRRVNPHSAYAIQWGEDESRVNTIYFCPVLEPVES